MTVNSQQESQRHIMPLLENLMWKLGGSCYFSKVDLVFNQIELAPNGPILKRHMKQLRLW